MSRAVLEELRGRWQAKLSSLMVADFPWDPQPTPPSPTTANGAGGNNNGENGLAALQQQQQQSQSQPHQQLLPSAASALPTPTSMTPAATNSATSSSGSTSAAVDGVRIKPEPGTEEDEVLLPSMSTSISPAPIAVAGGGVHRATALLQQKFGQKANPSIGALHQTSQKSPAGQAQAQAAAHPAAGRTDGACDDDGIPARLAHLALGGDDGIGGIGDAAWAAERAKTRIEGDEDGRERMRVDAILFRKRAAGDGGAGGAAEIRPLRQTRASRDTISRRSSTSTALPADPASSPSQLSLSPSPSPPSSEEDEEGEESVMLSFSSSLPPPPPMSPTQPGGVWTSQLDGTANHYQYQQQQHPHQLQPQHQYQHQLQQHQQQQQQQPPRVKTEGGRSVEIGEDDDDDDVVDNVVDARNGGVGGGVVGGGGLMGGGMGGGGDDDAINSDLDDPEDDLDDAGEDDEANPQIMLCMYDKVTRTKNKWKCILKDGVLTVGGREYVFQKATGEFEW